MARGLGPMAAGSLALIVALAACGSGAPADEDVLLSLTDQVIVPAYEDVARDMAQMDEAARALCEAPTEAPLEAARRSWLDARASWMRSEAAWLGPIMDRRSTSLLDWSPVDVEGIEELLAQGTVVTATDVREAMAADRRGFGAIELVLFGDGALAALTESATHCPYLLALTEIAREESGALLSDWVVGDSSQDPYKDYFTGVSQVSLHSSDAVADVVRVQVFLIRDVVDMRLASALGIRGDAPDLTAIPGSAADNGLHDLRNEVLGMQAMYQGAVAERLGISDLVAHLSEETDQRVRDQLAAAIAAIDAVEGPLLVAIAERPDQVRTMYERLQELQRTYATEVVSLLGVSVGFTDTDGDSAR